MNTNIKKLSSSALLIALAFILSFIKIMHLPFGGSVTLMSMFFIALPSYLYGVKYGIVASFTYSMLQLIADNYIVHPMQLILDYTIAFTVFGLVGLFRDKKFGLEIGFILACIVRFVSSSISGYIFFREYAPESWNPVIYTVTYNASYIFTECIFTVLVIQNNKVRKILSKYKK